MTRILTFSTVSLFLLLTTTPKLPAQDFEALAKEVAQELAGRQFDKVESAQPALNR